MKITFNASDPDPSEVTITFRNGETIEIKDREPMCRECGKRPMLMFWQGTMVQQRDGKCEVCYLKPTMHAFMDAWHALDDAFTEAQNAHNGYAVDRIAQGYPFDVSFDELGAQVAQWAIGVTSN